MITVAEQNDVPMFTSTALPKAREGAPYAFQITAADPEGSAVAYELVSGPAGATIHQPTGLITWAPGESDGGKLVSLVVRVTDQGQPPLSTSATISIAVDEVNSPPSLTNIVDRRVGVGTTFQLTAVGQDSDLPVNALAYSLGANVPAGVAIDPVTGELTWSPTAEQLGEHTIAIFVSDNGTPSRTASTTFKITVEAGNSPPTDVRLTSLNVKENLFAALVGTIEIDDVDGSETHVVAVSDSRFEVVGTTLKLKPDATLSRDVASTLPLTLTVTDSANQSFHRDFTLIVAANAFTWNNKTKSLDVDLDGIVAPIDALLVINELNLPRIIDSFGKLPGARPLSGCSYYAESVDCPFLDTTSDGFTSALDALLVINFLNEPLLGEGENIADDVSQTFAESRSFNATETSPAREASVSELADRYFEELGCARRGKDVREDGLENEKALRRAGLPAARGKRQKLFPIRVNSIAPSNSFQSIGALMWDFEPETKRSATDFCET